MPLHDVGDQIARRLLVGEVGLVVTRPGELAAMRWPTSAERRE